MRSPHGPDSTSSSRIVDLAGSQPHEARDDTVGLGTFRGIQPGGLWQGCNHCRSRRADTNSPFLCTRISLSDVITMTTASAELTMHGLSRPVRCTSMSARLKTRWKREDRSRSDCPNGKSRPQRLGTHWYPGRSRSRRVPALSRSLLIPGTAYGIENPRRAWFNRETTRPHCRPGGFVWDR